MKTGRYGRMLAARVAAGARDKSREAGEARRATGKRALEAHDDAGKIYSASITPIAFSAEQLRPQATRFGIVFCIAWRWETETKQRHVILYSHGQYST